MKNIDNSMKQWLKRGAIAATIAGALLVSTAHAGVETLRGSAVAEATQADVWKRAAEYEPGTSRVALTEIEGLVREALKGGPRRSKRVAMGLARLVESGEATTAARSFACRQLARIGSKESVPALAGLLTDASLAHMARYALQRIPDEEAGDALRDALGQTDGVLRIGIINSLGARRDRSAVSIVSDLLVEADRDTAVAIIEMLGEVGDKSAARVLTQLADARGATGAKAPTDLLADAVLRCADTLASEASVTVARDLYALAGREGHHTHVRIAGLRGLAHLQPVETAPVVADLLTSADPAWSGAARQLIVEVGGAEATLAYAGLLAAADGEQRLLLIEAIAERGDPNAAPEVMALMLGEDREVITAAIRALGSVGDDSCVSSLALLASAGSEDARHSLSSMRTPNVNAAIGAALLTEPVSEVRVELALALGARRATEQVKALLTAAKDDKFRDVRMAAISSIGTLAGPEHLSEMLVIATEVTDRKEAASAIDAVVAIGERAGDVDACTGPVIASLVMAGEQSRIPPLLRILGRFGGERALVAVSRYVYAEGETGAAAREAIAQWPDAVAAETLLDLAGRTTDPAVRQAAFRGFVGTASKPGGRSPEATVKLFRQSLELAQSDELKKCALEGIASLSHPDALFLAGSHLQSEATRREAALALVTVAHTVGDRHQDAARGAVERAVKACPEDDEIRRRAGAALDRIERFEDYVTIWHFAGPYKKKDTDGTAIFGVAFPPEPGGPEGEVEWREVPGVAIVEPGKIDLNKIEGASNTCGYLRTRIVAEKGCTAKLEIGSDDGVIVWLNGERVHAKNAMRGLSLGSDVVNVELREGENELLLKITQGGGGWEAAVRIRSEAGEHLDGIQVVHPR